jgi:hypothetical protein
MIIIAITAALLLLHRARDDIAPVLAAVVAAPAAAPAAVTEAPATIAMITEVAVADETNEMTWMTTNDDLGDIILAMIAKVADGMRGMNWTITNVDNDIDDMVAGPVIADGLDTVMIAATMMIEEEDGNDEALA